MTPLLRFPSRLIAYCLFSLLDHGIWMLIQLLPGPKLLEVARQRPWQTWQLRLTPARQQRWRHRVAWLLRTRCHRAGWGSTCLSRSFSGRMLFDLLGVANE